MKEKSYQVTPELKAEVEAVVREGKKPYEKFSHLVFESQIDASVFFEHELEGAEDETKDEEKI